MGPKQAVTIVNRRDIAAADDPAAERDRLADAYAEQHLDATVAASDGHVDEIIEPAATRARLAWGLSTLAGAPRGPHRGNLPL
jgi:acetyl-CoA carboxylase carboxyltransferase component